MNSFRSQTNTCRWEDVPVQGYKNDGTTTFKDITKQILFSEPELDFQWRYFEVAPGGYSSLERHEHAHAVDSRHPPQKQRRFDGRCVVSSGMEP